MFTSSERSFELATNSWGQVDVVIVELQTTALSYYKKSEIMNVFTKSLTQVTRTHAILCGTGFSNVDTGRVFPDFWPLVDMTLCLGHSCVDLNSFAKAMIVEDVESYKQPLSISTLMTLFWTFCKVNWFSE